MKLFQEDEKGEWHECAELQALNDIPVSPPVAQMSRSSFFRVKEKVAPGSTLRVTVGSLRITGIAVSVVPVETAEGTAYDVVMENRLEEIVNAG